MWKLGDLEGVIWTSPQQQTFIENPRQYISVLCHSSFIFRRWDELSCCALPAYNVILIVFMYQVDNVILKIDYCCKTSCMYQHQFLPASILYYYFFLFTWGVIFFLFIWGKDSIVGTGAVFTLRECKHSQFKQQHNQQFDDLFKKILPSEKVKITPQVERKKK